MSSIKSATRLITYNRLGNYFIKVRIDKSIERTLRSLIFVLSLSLGQLSLQITLHQEWKLILCRSPLEFVLMVCQSFIFDKRNQKIHPFLWGGGHFLFSSHHMTLSIGNHRFSKSKLSKMTWIENPLEIVKEL